MGDVASACRARRPAEQDVLLAALLAVATDEPLAQLAAIACLSRRLGSVVATWRREGIGPVELETLEADLVSACWAAVANLSARLAAGEELPPKLGLALVDAAIEEVRIPRRRERRAADHQVPLNERRGLGVELERSVADDLAREIAGAVRAGRISARAAAPVFLTRAAGFSTAEAAQRLGVSPDVLRAQRSRAERKLVAA